MAFKIVGVDENSQFPTRVMNALKALFPAKGDVPTKTEADAKYATLNGTYSRVVSDDRFASKTLAATKDELTTGLAVKADKTAVANLTTKSDASAIARAVNLESIRDVGIFDYLQTGIFTPLQDTRVVVLGSSTSGGLNARPTSAGAFQRLGNMSGAREYKKFDELTGNVAPGGMQWFYGTAFGAGDLNAQAKYTNMERVAPHYVLIMTGSNDWAQQTSLDQYENAIRTAVQAYETRSPGVRVVLIQQQARLDGVKAIPFTEYGKRLQKVAEEKPATRLFIDVAAEFNKLAILDGNRAGLVSPDNVHMMNTGHKFLFNVLASKMGVPSPSKFADSIEVLQFKNPPSSSPFTAGTDFDKIKIPAASYPRVFKGYGQVFVGDDPNGDLVWHFDRSVGAATEIVMHRGILNRGTLSMAWVEVLEPYVTYDVSYGVRNSGLYVSANPFFTDVRATIEAI